MNPGPEAAPGEVPEECDLPDRQTGALQSAELQTWLEWAGGKLIATPGHRVGPKAPGVAWPSYAQDAWEVTEFRGGLGVRAQAPGLEEIPWVDEILLLPNLCRDVLTRRVIHARLLVHPINRRHLYRWERIAKLLASPGSASIKTHTLKYWHKKGLVEICGSASPELIQRIKQFFAEPAL